MGQGVHEIFNRNLRGRALLSCALSHTIMHDMCILTGPFILIQDIGNPEQVPGGPDMDIDLLCCPGISMTEDCADELDGDTFFIKRCAEIVAERMRSEPRYLGVPRKFFTESVKTVS